MLCTEIRNFSLGVYPTRVLRSGFRHLCLTEEACCFGCSIFTHLRGPQETFLKNVSFFLNTQLMFLEREKDPTAKTYLTMTSRFDLAQRRQEITADILEVRITYDQDEVEPEKVTSHSNETTRCWLPREEPKQCFAIFHQLFFDE